MKWFRSQWDRASAALLVVLGLVTLLLGYLGASGTPYPAEQLPYMISGGVLGIFFLGAAAALYVSADLRDEWRKLNSIDASLKEIVGSTTLAEVVGTEPAGADPTDDSAVEADVEAPRARTRSASTTTRKTTTKTSAGKAASRSRTAATRS